MNHEKLTGSGEDWDVVQRVLPGGWQAKAKDLGALRRCRMWRSSNG